MMILAKVHKAEGRAVLVLCDQSIFGKCYTEGKKQLDLASDFYKGEPAEDREQLLDRMRAADIISIAGKESIALAMEAGIVDKGQIKTIAGIPYAQIVFV